MRKSLSGINQSRARFRERNRTLAALSAHPNSWAFLLLNCRINLAPNPIRHSLIAGLCCRFYQFQIIGIESHRQDAPFCFSLWELPATDFFSFLLALHFCTPE